MFMAFRGSASSSSEWNASQPTNLTRARKSRVRFLRRAETSKKPSRFEAPLSNSGSSAAGSRYGGGKALIALLSASIFGVGLVQSRGRVAS
jgi:hypothetical protein